MNRLIVLLLVGCAGCSTDPLDEDRDLRRPDLGAADDGVATFDGAADGPSSLEDMGTGPADVGEPDLGPGFCQPNRDGTVERAEVTLQAGLSAKFAVATDVAWDTAGVQDENGITWDLAEGFESDATALVELRDPAGQWFETTFADADYFTPLGASSDLLGVFRVTDEAVLLLGVVSPDEGLLATELEYEPPVPVLKFPVQEGDSWSVESDVTGTYQGVFTVYTESYQFEADRSGTLLTPFGSFAALRVRSVLERQVGLLTTVIRSFAFVSECFGTVATVASQENESAVEFTEISELRRLTP